MTAADFLSDIHRRGAFFDPSWPLLAGALWVHHAIDGLQRDTG
jgi:hypothetical protein